VSEAALSNIFEEAKSVLENTVTKISEVQKKVEKAEIGGFENTCAYVSLFSVSQAIESCNKKLRLLRSEPRPGILKKHPEKERFYVLFDDGEEGPPVVCGDFLEVFKPEYTFIPENDRWELFEVDSDLEGRHFFKTEPPIYLKDGEKIRIRER
jgi:hypothetical protein